MKCPIYGRDKDAEWAGTAVLGLYIHMYIQTCVVVSLGLLLRPFLTLILIIDQTPIKKILWFITLLCCIGLSLQILFAGPKKTLINLFDQFTYVSTSCSPIGWTGYSGYAWNFRKRHVSSTLVIGPGGRAFGIGRASVGILVILDSDRGGPSSSCPCWVRGGWWLRLLRHLKSHLVHVYDCLNPRWGLQAVKRMSSRPCIASPLVPIKSHTGSLQWSKTGSGIAHILSDTVVTPTMLIQAHHHKTFHYEYHPNGCSLRPSNPGAGCTKVLAVALANGDRIHHDGCSG